MGSGEGDAIRNVLANTTNTFDGTTWSYSSGIIYKYQIQCPKAKCKTMNWLQLNQITPCAGCGAKLKAVTEQPDFEIPVTP